jgi:hypothetical protein
MRARPTLVAALVATALAAGVLPARAVGSPADLPRATCTKRVTDPAGDAFADMATVSPASFDQSDITSLTLRLTPDELQVFLELRADLPAPASLEPGVAYFWDVTFSYDTRLVEATTMLAAANQPPPPVPPAQPYPWFRTGARGANATAAPDFAGEKAYVGPAWAPRYVVFTAPRSSVEAVVGAIPDDAELSAIAATAGLVTPNLSRVIMDRAPDNAKPKGTVKAGDTGYCFGPPPAALTALTGGTAQYGDPATLRATLKADSGTPLAGQPVEFRVDGDPVARTVTTDASGVAELTYVPPQAAGTYAVTAAYAGDATDGAARAAGAELTVVAERTSLQAARTGTGHKVTATLTDDDRHPVAGQRVAWLAGGKQVATGTTDRSGRCTYAATAGQRVQARFAAVAGKYAAATSKTVTA